MPKPIFPKFCTGIGCVPEKNWVDFHGGPKNKMAASGHFVWIFFLNFQHEIWFPNKIFLEKKLLVSFFALPFFLFLWLNWHFGVNGVWWLWLHYDEFWNRHHNVILSEEYWGRFLFFSLFFPPFFFFFFLTLTLN